MTTKLEERQILSAQVPRVEVERLRALARQHERSMSAELRLALAAHLAQQGQAS